MKKQISKPQQVKKETWQGRPYREAVANGSGKAAPMTEYTRVCHPITGVGMSGLEFQAEVATAKAQYGQWPAPELEKESNTEPICHQTAALLGAAAINSAISSFEEIKKPFNEHASSVL